MNKQNKIRPGLYADKLDFHSLKRELDIDSKESGNIALRQLRDNLTSHVAEELRSVVRKFMVSHDAKCDGEDLRKQILFRLLTFSVKDVFHNGDQLDKYLKKVGIYSDWRNIPLVESKETIKYNVDLELIKDVLAEQYSIIAKRMEGNTIKLGNIAEFTDSFDSSRWHIRKINGRVYASQMDGRLIPLVFAQVDTDYAYAVFNYLHYLHAPRIDMAYGLFIEGCDVPFSVQGICKVDRDYKQEGLFLHGYNYKNSWELTRLYNYTGAPMFTSSFVISSTIKCLKNDYPQTEAVITTISPSLENGRSIIGSGFENILVAKSERLIFSSGENMPGMYRITRRQMRGISDVIYNKIPILPKLVLARYLTEPIDNALMSKDEAYIL